MIISLSRTVVSDKTVFFMPSFLCRGSHIKVIPAVKYRSLTVFTGLSVVLVKCGVGHKIYQYSISCRGCRRTRLKHLLENGSHRVEGCQGRGNRSNDIPYRQLGQLNERAGFWVSSLTLPSAPHRAEGVIWWFSLRHKKNHIEGVSYKVGSMCKAVEDTRPVISQSILTPPPPPSGKAIPWRLPNKKNIIALETI